MSYPGTDQARSSSHQKRLIVPPQSDSSIQPGAVYWNRLEIDRSAHRCNQETSVRAYDDILIRVHCEWNGWRSAEVRLADLSEVYWFQPAGAPQAIVHGYISCSSVVTGDIPHDCDRRSAPHRQLVCILKRHAIPTVYTELARRADEQRRLPSDTRGGWTVRRCSTPIPRGHDDDGYAAARRSDHEPQKHCRHSEAHDIPPIADRLKSTAGECTDDPGRCTHGPE